MLICLKTETSSTAKPHQHQHQHHHQQHQNSVCQGRNNVHCEGNVKRTTRGACQETVPTIFKQEHISLIKPYSFFSRMHFVYKLHKAEFVMDPGNVGDTK